MRSPKRRLELTWMGKDMALTATRLTQMAAGRRHVASRFEHGFDAYESCLAGTNNA
jgi:hypothetical protein